VVRVPNVVNSFSHEVPNYTMNLTACGAFLLPHGDRDGDAHVEEVGPPAAGYGGRSTDMIQ
jgi:hypothetical protein